MIWAALLGFHVVVAAAIYLAYLLGKKRDAAEDKAAVILAEKKLEAEIAVIDAQTKALLKRKSADSKNDLAAETEKPWPK